PKICFIGSLVTLNCLCVHGCVILLRGNCPMFWYSYGGRCYKYVATSMTWGDAELHCVSQNANLVSVHSLKEDNLVKMLIRNFDPAEAPTWIGLSDTFLRHQKMFLGQ
uniref:C-type lectin domain-containing protein n=1 Tax=Oryzias latipes TaxID=8090 RepID=A0A3B3IA13_ORYLA